MRLGIIGTGRIAGRFVPECETVPEVRITAVYNPHEGSAQRFVEGNFTGPEKIMPLVFSEINSLWDEVDGVYIASPHDTHFGYIMQALEHGKHVLCEKPMVLSSDQAKKAFDFSRENDRILMEGLKTAYCPGYEKLVETAKSGIIGDVRHIEACFTKLEDPSKRELTDTVYGGSFTELGSYVMLPVLDILGMDIAETGFDQIKDEKGIDLFTKINIKYNNSMASLTCGLGVKSEGRLLVAGTKGFIKAEAPWWKTRNFEVHFEDESKTTRQECEFEKEGLRYEIIRFVELAGDTAGLEARVAYKDSQKRSLCMAEIIEAFLSERKD